MALPQDGQEANGLTKVTEIPAGKELMFIDPTTNEGGIITLENLTKQILKGLTTQAFTLDAGQQTLIQAINDINKHLTNRLIGVDVTAWAESLNQDGFFVFRTDNTCTGQPTNGIYSMGYVIYFKGNIRIVIHDMFSPSEIYTRSKANGNSWSVYKKIATNNI